MSDLKAIGRDWLIKEVLAMDDKISRVTPVKFNEENRYLPQSVSPRPGYIRYDLFPFLKEIIECFDPFSPVREVNLKKGVQVGYTTLLESILLYYIAHIRTQSVMYLTADKELAKGRVENNILPMINESGFSGLIRSSDEGNQRKTGKALSLDTLIPTPRGLREMREIHVGDEVYAMDGTIVNVITESPIHERESYEVVFANGQKIIAGEDHRWSVLLRGNVTPARIRTTRQIFESGTKVGMDYRFRVCVPQETKGTLQKLPVAPYTLGAWLGDGSSADPMISAGAGGRIF